MDDKHPRLGRVNNQRGAGDMSRPELTTGKRLRAVREQQQNEVFALGSEPIPAGIESRDSADCFFSGKLHDYIHRNRRFAPNGVRPRTVAQRTWTGRPGATDCAGNVAGGADFPGIVFPGSRQIFGRRSGGLRFRAVRIGSSVEVERGATERIGSVGARKS